MNSLKEYGELFISLGLSELEVQEGNNRIRLKRDSVKNDTSDIKLSTEAKPAIEAPSKVTGKAITAPLLGIFYELNGENSAVAVGDMVQKGDVLCNIEAMKMMNEVKAPFSGKIVEVCAREGDLVEFGQKLFVVEE